MVGSNELMLKRVTLIECVDRRRGTRDAILEGQGVRSDGGPVRVSACTDRNSDLSVVDTDEGWTLARL